MASEEEIDRIVKRRGRATTFVILVWSVVLLAGTAYLLLIKFSGDVDCEAVVGSSNYGRRSWSWLPPGPTCTYSVELNGFDLVTGPSPVTTIWLVVLVVGAASWVNLLRAPSNPGGSLKVRAPDRSGTSSTTPSTTGDRNVR